MFSTIQSARMRFTIIFFILAILSLISAQNGGHEIGQPGLTQKANPENPPQYPEDKAIFKDEKMNKNDNSIQQQDIGNGIDRSVTNVGTAAMNGIDTAANSAVSLSQIFKILPKCYQKCLRDVSVATSSGCSGSNDIDCLCSRPQLLNSLKRCANLDKECSQNSNMIEQGQNIVQNICQNQQQQQNQNPNTLSSSSGRSRWPIPNSSTSSQLLSGGIALIAVFFGIVATTLN